MENFLLYLDFSLLLIVILLFVAVGCYRLRMIPTKRTNSLLQFVLAGIKTNINEHNLLLQSHTKAVKLELGAHKLKEGR